MLARHERVRQAVIDAGRDADLCHVEAPRLDPTEGVVDAFVRSALAITPEPAAPTRSLAGHSGFPTLSESPIVGQPFLKPPVLGSLASHG
jgi:hypothetical protein